MEYRITKDLPRLNKFTNLFSIYTNLQICGTLAKTPFLTYLVSTNNLDVIKLLSEYTHLDTNAIDDNGNTALNIAIELGHIQIVKFLLTQKNIDVYIKNNKNQNAIDIAHNMPSSKIYTEIIYLFILKDLELCEINFEGSTPLIYNVVNNKYKCVAAAMIDTTIDINQVDRDGNTALNYAVIRNNSAMVRLLLDFNNLKTDVCIKNNNNLDALDISNILNLKEINKILKLYNNIKIIDENI